jgi:hypothetical protein
MVTRGLGLDGVEDRRQENALDAPAPIPQFREVVEGPGSKLTAVLAQLGDTASLDDVRDAVATYARAARRGAIAPEQMLILLKRLLWQAKAARGATASPWLGPLERGVVEAAIADYFAAPRV